MLERFSEIVFDRRGGSSQIAVGLLRYLEEAVPEEGPDVVKLFLEELYATVLKRRSLVSPINLVGIMKQAYTISLEESGHMPYLREMIRQLRRMYEAALEAALRSAEKRLAQYSTVLTLSKSSQVISTVKRIIPRESRVLVGWPLMDGLAAYRELKASGLNAILLPDLSVHEALTGVDALLLGCDAVLPDGSAVNRSGSGIVALAAREAGIPTFIICDSTKLDINNLWEAEKWSLTVEGAPVEFQVFERIDSGLVTEYISELGCLAPASFVDAARKEVGSWPRRLSSQQR
ncbi:MAG: hypothetical protein QXM16_01090 [Nitrososphaerota archaeon]